jgi:hypothetical protein
MLTTNKTIEMLFNGGFGKAGLTAFATFLSQMGSLKTHSRLILTKNIQEFLIPLYTTLSALI